MLCSQIRKCLLPVVHRGLCRGHVHLPRVYVDRPIGGVGGESGIIDLDQDVSHYLANVMRMKEGSQFRAFNSTEGEFLLELIRAPSSIRKHGLHHRPAQRNGARSDKAFASIVCKLRGIEEAQAENIPVALYFAPVKKAKIKVMVATLTELGAGMLVPIKTQRTQKENIVGFPMETLQSCILEAVEQSERLTIPTLEPPIELLEVLHRWQLRYDNDEKAGVRVTSLLVCKERADQIGQKQNGNHCKPLLSTFLENGLATSISATLLRGKEPKEVDDDLTDIGADIGLIVGPEGGFTDEEWELFRQYPVVQMVSLGGNVLRAETASAAAMASVSSALEHLRASCGREGGRRAEKEC